MELKDFFENSILLGYYKNLLSDKQKQYMIEFFEEDYSLSEIAKNHSVSRQAVHENIKRGVHTLKEYEEKISVYKRDLEIKSSLEDLKENFTEDKLEKIIEKFF